MDELKLIKQLESLKQVKPNSNWVALSKGNILSKQFEVQGTAATFASIFNTIGHAFETPRVLAPILASLIVSVFGVALITAQSGNAVPGENLYSLKQVVEGIQMSMLSPEDMAVAKVGQLDKRLSELDKITKESENQGKKLVAGIAEAQKALSVASKELSRLPETQKAELIGSIVAKIEEIEKTTNASIMENSSEDYQAFYKFLALSEIKELEANEKNLTDKQQALLAQARESFDLGKYIEAVETLYKIQPKIEE
jgi:cell division protein FtsB